MNPLMKSELTTPQKRKPGWVFGSFFLYLFFYGGFVAIGVLNYELMAIKVVAGLNLALVYGMGLILFAVLLGILYNYFCSKYEDEMNEKEEDAA